MHVKLWIHMKHFFDIYDKFAYFYNADCWDYLLMLLEELYDFHK